MNLSTTALIRSSRLGAAAAPVAITGLLLSPSHLDGSSTVPAPAIAQSVFLTQGARTAELPIQDDDAIQARVARLEQMGPADSPFPRLEKVVERIEEFDPQPEGAPALEFTLSSVLDSPRGAMAVINGVVRRVGDEIAPGWRVGAVEPDSGAVTLRRADGETKRVVIAKPSSR